MLGQMSDSGEKSRLAQELLDLLRTDIGNRVQKQKDAQPRPKVIQSTEAMATGHQKRDNKRFSYPVLRVTIGTDGYNTIDWSLGGVQVKDYVGPLKQYARVKIAVAEGKAGSTYYSVECRVARIDTAKRVLSLQFQNTSRQLFDWLSGLQLMQSKRRA